MKLEWHGEDGGAGATIIRDFFVEGESDRLTDVLLCAPSHLEPVPCCSVTRESLRKGLAVSVDKAERQHRALRGALADHQVRCHLLPAHADLPDLCFTRDTGVATPWGLVALNPAMPHRAREADHVAQALSRLGARPVRRIREGRIEGGDICLARRGLLILGISGERTDEAGAHAFAEPFAANGWDILRYPFDPHFLHLDTQFCMLDAHHALACVDVLDDAFLAAVEARGITLLPVSYKEARGLGCNILSIDGRTILMGAGHDDVAARISAAGFQGIALDVSQFAACGGGIHCMTMPLRRTAG